ncbi:MAG: glycosyltransferase family 39 protein [Polyangiaceae bacterium]|nr:glycosyltransferase family 39 protein [Polyangiaceae bacterium]
MTNSGVEAPSSLRESNQETLAGAPEQWSVRDPSSGWGQACLLAALGLALRLAIAIWGSARFPPSDDGSFYHVVAQRIAQGFGYTWLWPDGSVTYAAHYPVGYPGMVGAAYAVFGHLPLVAMCLNACVGALGVLAVHRLLHAEANSRVAWIGGLAVALNPTLLFYTPALMTEGVVAAGLALLAWACVPRADLRGLWLWLLTVGSLGGLLTLLRPQSLLLVAALAFVSAHRERWFLRAGRALAVTIIACAVCLPWTLRNCERLERCVLVSANGGWNLLIGTSEKAQGGWISVDEMGVPEKCRNVFQEAHKDACFGHAGVTRILQDPIAWLRLVPSKLGNTFNYATPAAYYLGAANSNAFPEAPRTWLGAAELLSTRLATGAALMACGRRRISGRKWRWWLMLGGVLALVTPWAWLSFVCLAILGLFSGSTVGRFAGATVAVTALTHAVFFGASRYALVCLPLLIALAAQVLRSKDAESPRQLVS